MSRIILASRDPQLETRIRGAFNGSLNGHLRRWANDPLGAEPSEVVADLANGAPDVVAFGPDVSLETALKLARVLDRERPEITVVLVTQPSAKLWEHAMKAGVDVVVSPEAGDDELREEFERVLEAADRRRVHLTTESDPSSRSHKVITVTAPKGGVGKSIVATNLAMGLATAEPGKVAIVDLDLQFGDVGGGLQLQPQHTIVDAARAPGLDLTSLKVFLTAHPSDLYALCAPDTPAEADEIDGKLTTQILELLTEEFKYVVVDTTAGIDEHTLAALEASTDMVFVGNMDVPTVKALRKEVEVLDQLGMIRQVRHFVLNRADSRVGLDPADVEATVGMHVDIAVPSSRSVPLSFNQGVPIVQADPRAPAAKELMKLVGRFAELPAATQNESGGFLPWRRN